MEIVALIGFVLSVSSLITCLAYKDLYKYEKYRADKRNKVDFSKLKLAQGIIDAYYNEAELEKLLFEFENKPIFPANTLRK